MTRYTLGLDLGSNSVGWAMIANEGQAFPNGKGIIAGVRVFPEGVGKTTTGAEQPRGQDRRVARGQRRMHYRRRQRRRLLARILKEAGLLPRSDVELAKVRALDPYEERTTGLDKPLEPYHFGRALMHICQRRGFKSNRKTEKKADDGKVAKETAALQREIEKAGCRTLGEYMARRAAEFEHKKSDSRRIRKQYTLRSMYENEFEMLWKSQAAFCPKVLNEELKAKVKDAIFFQRPLRYDPATIGDCELEPGEKRCPRAHWLAQQFRMLQEINHLCVLEPGVGERPLSKNERNRLAQALGAKKEMTFDQIRKCLGLLDGQQFNFEDRAKRKKLRGNEVEASLRHALGTWYEDAPADLRERIHNTFAEIEDEGELRRIATAEWDLSEAQAAKLLKADAPKGHFSLSLKAVRKILPFLEQGYVFSDAKDKAGYSIAATTQRLDRLPPVDKAVKYLTNPLVHRALTEVRKVVNAMVREYGAPTDVVIELARDMKKTRPQREEATWENREREKENNAIRDRLVSDFGILSPRSPDIQKYRLWQECGGVCVYTGRPIPQTALFTGEVQVEHIFPYSRSLDDSYYNKTLCYVDENARKHNQTPYEAYNGDPERYEKVLEAARCLPYEKRRRFTQKEIDLDKFVQRQLNDTRYISTQAVRYLAPLVGGRNVRCVKGGTTAELRWQWGLTGLWANGGARDGDHRRHAVDAVVVALTTRAALQRLSAVKYNPERPQFEPPWEGFRDDVLEAWTDINVSFRPTRKLAGGLHDETGLGPVKDCPQSYVHRVPVENLTVAMVAQIRDPAIRKLVEDRCRERRVDLEGSGKIEKAVWTPVLTMPSGVPIKRVRITTESTKAVPVCKTRQLTGGPKQTRFAKPGENYRIVIYGKPKVSCGAQNAQPSRKWAWEDIAECTGAGLSLFQASAPLRRSKKARKEKPFVDINPQKSGWTLLFAFCKNDMVLLTNPKTGECGLYRVQKTSIKSDSGQPYIVFRLHLAANIKDDSTMVRVQTWETFLSWRPQKVTVDPIGRVFPCHD